MNETILVEEIQSLIKKIEEKKSKYLAIKKQQLVGKYVVLKSGKCFHIKCVGINWDKSYLSVPEVRVEAIFVNSQGEDCKYGKTTRFIYQDTPLSDLPNPQAKHFEIYEGVLSLDSNGEENDILSIDDGNSFLAEVLAEHIEEYGRNLTVSYWISDQKLTKEQLTESFLGQLMGESDAEYAAQYSEYTGYLYTTEEIEVGGHDLLTELKGYIGKYLYMEIEFDY